jgi:4-aminobutyrate aminotransferase-like enzyme
MVRMRDHGILLSLDGPYSNVLKMKPPMVFNKSNAKTVVEKLDQVLENFKIKSHL